MSDIKNNFTKFGRFFSMHEESPNAFIFAIANERDGKPVYFEIFEKRPYRPMIARFGNKEVTGTDHKWKYAYPANESFGKWAWTTTTLQYAKMIQQKIEDKHSQLLTN